MSANIEVNVNVGSATNVLSPSQISNNVPVITEKVEKLNLTVKSDSQLRHNATEDNKENEVENLENDIVADLPVITEKVDQVETEELSGFAVTPAGELSSYKGVPTTELLSNSKKVTEEPPKPRNKGNKKSKQQQGTGKTTKPAVDVPDRMSFTQKLQQFLSSSKSIFSPQRKDSKSEESEIEKSSSSSKTKKSLEFGVKDAVTDPSSETIPVKAAAETKETGEFGPISFKDKLLSEPESKPAAATEASTSVVSSENKKPQLYSREDLMALSKNPASYKKPDVTDTVEPSVAKDIDLGKEVSKKYLPIRILSREFKLKYRF